MIGLVLICFCVGFVIGATRERVVNKNYNKFEVGTRLTDMANYVATKELRDDFDKNHVEWSRKIESFKNYLINLNK